MYILWIEPVAGYKNMVKVAAYYLHSFFPELLEW
jgi:hypothetical protein